ncbi:MAG: hypothetical protein SH847_26720 [Roseiflexaceae bacterium]|nr:hypothetical protein [Roseiflexaceae bacterium]
MQAYRQELVVQHDGTLTLHGLPLRAGEKVEIIVIVQVPSVWAGKRYPLRGTPISYAEPTEPADDTNWEVAA